MHKQENLTQATIHLNTHDHPVVEGCSRKVVEQVKPLLQEEVACTSGATTLAIALVVSNNFLSKHLLVEVLKGDKLHKMMNKFVALFSSNVRNLVASFKHWPRKRKYISSILVLKGNIGYDYIQNNCFPRQ